MFVTSGMIIGAAGIYAPSRLAFYDEGMQFVTEPGRFTFSVGASSADVRSTAAISLAGEVAPYRQREIIATRVGVERLEDGDE